jgi:mono/diheme cytochrome c family protein
MRILRFAFLILVLLAAAAGAYVWHEQEPVIPGNEHPPQRGDFDEAAIRKGAKLSALGNCDVCHTAPGGAPYAGGRPIPTPIGTVYSSNITPAIGTGIGRWPEAAFARAMRDGVARRGEHLYPAFPYDHYARLSDDDVRALYAFVMTRTPVEIVPPGNELTFPLNQRWGLIFWNLLFFDRTPFHADPQHNAEWNRGAYLVKGLGHCGDCHTPRDWFGAEKTSQALAGGEAENWRAPALDSASPAPVPWDAAHLFTYLRQGWDVDHGAAAGPMQPVAQDLAEADEADVHAIAAYLAERMGEPSPERKQRAAELLKRAAGPADLPKPAPGEELGATLFAGACAACHAGGPAMVPPRGIDLSLSTAINEADPRDAIYIVLDGIRPEGERSGPLMPRFDGAFTDAQLAALLHYVRAHYGNGQAWPNLEKTVHDIRQSKERS